MADITTSSSTSMPAWAQPYAQGYLQRAQQVADTPYQAYTGQRVADMNPYQTGAFQGIANRAVQGSPVMSAANQALPGMFNPTQGATQNPYAGSNPYLQQNIDAAQGDLARNWNNVAAPSWATANQQSGSFGNAGLALAENNARDSLQRNMGQIGSSMRMQDYTQQQQLGESFAGRNDSMFNAGQGRALSALGLAPTFANQDYNDLSQLQNAGAALQSQQQRGLDSSYQQFMDAQNYPTRQLDIMGNALGRSYGQNTTTTQPGPSTASTLAGGALTGAALYNLLFGG